MTVQQKIREWIDTEGVKWAETNRTAYFGFIHKDGTSSSLEGGACHATVLGYGRYTPTAAIISRIRRDGADNCKQSENSVRFYDWLFNRSPFASVFMYKVAQARFDEGWCVVSANHPANLVQGALITSRNSWEFPQNVDRWAKLVDLGVDENLAYLMVHFLSDMDKTTISLTRRSHQHVALGLGLSHKGAKAYVTCQPLNLHKKYSEGGEATGVFSLFESGEAGSSPFLDKLTEDLKEYIKGIPKTKCMNPFAAAKAKSGDENKVSVSYEKLAEFLIQYKDKVIA